MATGKFLNKVKHEGTLRGRLHSSASRFALLFGAVLLSHPAHADSVYWNGPANGDWFSDGNWVWDGHTPGSADSARIDSSGPLILSGSTAQVGNLLVGITGTGNLGINGTLNSGSVTLGYNSGSSGTILVSGGTWTNSGDIVLGGSGSGTLTISNGGVVTAVNGYAANLQGSNATLTVTGANSALNFSNTFIAGYNAGSTASVTISNGGQISAALGTLGDMAGASGSMSVSGAGSKWSAVVDNNVAYSGYLNVGREGTGDLSVTNGGTVTGYRLYIGNEAGSQGTVTLSGSGSSIWMDNNIYVGSEGTGTLTLSDGAVLHATAIKVGYLAGSVGTLNVGAAAGQAAAAAGTIEADQIVLGDGDSQLVLNHTATDYTIASDISGAGSVVVSSGTTTLTGNNTYSGGTTLNGGTLIGSATSFGTGAITNNAPLVLDQATDATFDNALSGSGTLTKTGAGVLNLTSDSSSFTGATTVSAGELKVNGSLAGSAVSVENGARISGSGAVGALTAEAGSTVAPGNSPGTLTVNGNYSQAAGATYNAEIVPGGTVSDLISATGTATIANGAILKVSKYGSGSYVLGTRYTVLTAAGGVTGTYTLSDAAITSFYGMAAAYDANNVYLDVTQTRAFTSAAITSNQMATAGALQNMATSSALRGAIGNIQTDAEARDAFDQLSGDIYSSIKGAMVEDSRFVRSAAIDRIRAAFDAGGLQAASQATDGLTVWSNGYGGWGNVDSDGNAAKLSHSTGGFLIGADAPVFDMTRIGLLTGYSRSTYGVDGRNASGSSDNATIGAYGGTQFGALGVRFGTAYTWSNVSTSRQVAFSGFSDSLSGKYNAATFQAFVSVR